MEEIKVTTEMVENTTEVAMDVAESVVEKAGMSLGAKAGIVGGVLVLGAAAYATVRYFRNKKAKDNAGEEAPEVVEAEGVEKDSEETAE